MGFRATHFECAVVDGHDDDAANLGPPSEKIRKDVRWRKVGTLMEIVGWSPRSELETLG